MVESAIPPGNQPFAGRQLDLVLMLIPNGEERTDADYRSLLGEAGFKITQVIPSATEVSVIEGKKKSVDT